MYSLFLVSEDYHGTSIKLTSYEEQITRKIHNI